MTEAQRTCATHSSSGRAIRRAERLAGGRLLGAALALDQCAQLVRVHRLLVVHVSERRAAHRRRQTARTVRALERPLRLLRLRLSLRDYALPLIITFT